jgi:hypothetical protein
VDSMSQPLDTDNLLGVQLVAWWSDLGKNSMVIMARSASQAMSLDSRLPYLSAHRRHPQGPSTVQDIRPLDPASKDQKHSS